MHEYDVVLKILLQKSIQRLTGTRIMRWAADRTSESTKPPNRSAWRNH